MQCSPVDGRTAVQRHRCAPVIKNPQLPVELSVNLLLGILGQLLDRPDLAV